MINRELTVAHRYGIHVKVAVALVRLSRTFRSRISIQRNSSSASARSVLELLMLAAEEGSRIVVTIMGDDEDDAMLAVEKLLTEDIG